MWNKQKCKYWSLLAIAGFVALLSLAQSAAALVATAPNLGSESTFGVVSGTFTNSNTPPQTIINGDVCFTTGPTTVPVTITGTTGACPAAAGGDQLAALVLLNGQACTDIGTTVALNTISILGGPPGTFPPGCYSSSGAMDIVASTTVTLDGAGVYIFKPDGAITTGADSFVVLANGACASDVFWAPTGATTLGAFTTGGIPPLTPTFVGNIFRGTAEGLSITLGHFANLSGRALAFGSTVTTDANTITVPPTCAPVASASAIPTLSQWAQIGMVALLVLGGLLALRRRPAPVSA